MKDNLNIDELLNGYIDGELTQRHQVEVQRLITHDANIAKRLRELQKCKMLITSLPCAEAPAELLEDVKISLERRLLLARQPERPDNFRGARHLLIRNVSAVAAMIGLVAILSVVVYTIVAPPDVSDKSVASEDWVEKKIKVEKYTPTPAANVEKTVAKTSLPEMGFSGRLELKTSTLVAVDAFINKAIEENAFADCIISRSQGDESTYTLNCGRENLDLLLADLKSIWDKFDSATLFVDTEQLGRQVVVNAVTAEQVAEIADQDSSQNCVETAKDFAILNNVASLLPGREMLAVVDGGKESLMIPPKPVLTSGKKIVKKSAGQAEDQRRIRLTILVVGSQKNN